MNDVRIARITGASGLALNRLLTGLVAWLEFQWRIQLVGTETRLQNISTTSVDSRTIVRIREQSVARPIC
jgi:hypothetical protein